MRQVKSFLLKDLRTLHMTLSLVRSVVGVHVLKHFPMLFPLVVVAQIMGIILIDKHCWHQPFFTSKRMMWNILLLISNMITTIINIEVSMLMAIGINLLISVAGWFIFERLNK